MPVESWTSPDDLPALAASASAMIDAALVGSGLSRDAYWAAVRKGYNTPYNDPPPKAPRAGAAAPVALAPTITVTVAGPEAGVPIPILAAAAAAEAHPA